MSGELVEWLRAQLDDEERVARATVERYTNPETGESRPWPRARVVGVFRDGDDRGLELIAEFSPARVLREVESKRALLDFLVDLENKARDNNWWSIDVDEAIRRLAQPYADRPGYREEWKP